jgi:cell wall assembly regulator SMI1
MRSIWERIEVWLADNAPEILDSLQSGATDDVLSEMEAFLNVTFPQDVRNSYALHNGQTLESPGLVEGRELLSLDAIRYHWSVWKELVEDGALTRTKSLPDGPIQNDWWNPKWIPLTYDGNSNHHCLDLNPAPGGDVGQIIMMWHDDPTRSLVASSFGAWLELFAQELEAGEYVYSDEEYALVRKDEL